MRVIKTGMVLGGYTLEEVIGEGGYATVFAARGPSGELVAVKVLHLVQAIEGEEEGETRKRRAELEKRFHLEIQALRTIKSPYVVRYISHDQEEDGTPYLVMELVAGQCLRSILDETRYLPTIVALNHAREICLGLAVAHTHKIVHRDVKPGNVIVGQIIRLVDFGAVQMNGSNGNLTNTVEAVQSGRAVVLGTLDYMAPEQAALQTITGACDMFAVGVLLYEMLTGQRLLLGFDVGELYHQIANGKTTLEDATQRLDPRVIAYYPKVNELFPEDVPSSFGIATTFVARGLYAIDPELTAPFGKRVHKLLVRLTSYHPEDRPTAEEAAAELEELILAMSSREEETEAPLEAEPLPESEQPADMPRPVSQEIPLIRPAPRSAVMLLASALGAVVAICLVLVFGNRQQPVVYVRSSAARYTTRPWTPTITRQTKPPETARVESVAGSDVGCRMAQRHGKPRKICPRPEQHRTPVRHHERRTGRRHRH